MEWSEDISKSTTIYYNRRVPSLVWYSLSYFISISTHYLIHKNKYIVFCWIILFSISLLCVISLLYKNRQFNCLKPYKNKIVKTLFCITFFMLGQTAPKCDIELGPIPKLYGSLTKPYIEYTQKKIIDHTQVVTKNESCRGILLAIIIGEKKFLKRKTIKAMRSTGAAHIMAVSGLHTGIVISFISLLLYPIIGVKYGKEIIFITTVILIIIYVHITSFTPSVIRASIIAIFILISSLNQRKIVSINLASICSIIFLTINTNSLTNLSFQLSFTAYISIILIYSRIKDFGNIKNRILDKIWKLCALSLSCWFGTLPLTIFYFKTITPYFLLSNIILIPLTTLATYLYFVSAILYFTLKIELTIINKLVEVILNMIILFAISIEKLPFSQITLY